MQSMQYPRTIIDIVDNSQTPEITINQQAIPLVMTAFASPKGTEDLVTISGNEFYSNYINSIGVDFKRYGQALLQAEAVINAGGKLLAKRVVAEDATLANLSVVAKVTTKQVQKVDANGNPVFKDPETNKEIVAPGVFAAIVPTKSVTKPDTTGTAIKKITKTVSTVTPAPVKESGTTTVPTTIKPGAGVVDGPKTVEQPKAPVAKPEVIPVSPAETDGKTPAASTGNTTSGTSTSKSDSTTTPDTKPATPAAPTTGTGSTTAPKTPVKTAPIPVMETVVVVTYECNTTSGAYTMSNITPGISNLLDTTGTNGTFTYPLFVISDVGRGVSEKKIQILPNYQESRGLGTMIYNLEVLEDGKTIETLPFNLNQNLVINGMNTSIETVVANKSKQIKCTSFGDSITAFIAKVAELGNISVKTASSLDLLFGKDILNPSSNLIGYEVDLTDGINLQYAYGIELDSGTNGAFGEAPIGTEAYETQLLNFFNGTYTSHIYDLDNYKVDLVIDANYPKSVKRAIEDLAVFREDYQFLEDVGTGCYTLDDILAMANEALSTENGRVATIYGQSYDVLDPHTMKQINVTICYSLAKLIVNHFVNGRTRPFAGDLYGVIINDIIPGTLNYLPKVTPNVDEKAIFVANRVNYGSFYNQKFVVETLLTHQSQNTQLSYTSNMFAIQEIVKAIRTECPKIRYSFITGKDLEKYKADVERVLGKFSGNFAALNMVYLEKPTMTQNKIFCAAIQVTFNNFVQTEYFTIYALQ